MAGRHGAGVAGHRKTAAFVGALRLEGMTVPMVIDGTMHGAAFLVHVEQVPAPAPIPGDIVMDEVTGDFIHIAPRKGLFAARKRSTDWSISMIGFAGNPVSQVLQLSGGLLLAALNLGHFGTKLHRSDGGGRTWHKVTAPTLPPDADTELAAELIWCLGEARSGSGHLWAGTIPGALFRSLDGGETWSLNDALWHRTERSAWWGGGYDQPGIHSILVDPRDPIM